MSIASVTKREGTRPKVDLGGLGATARLNIVQGVGISGRCNSSVIIPLVEPGRVSVRV